MQDKRTRFFALIILAAICGSIGYWLYLWSTDVFLYWGASMTLSYVLAGIFVCIALATILIHPIPIKVTTIATINLLFFSLLSTLLQLLFRKIWPQAANIGFMWQGGIFASASVIAMLIYGYFHGKRMLVTHYTIEASLPVIGGELLIALISDVHMGLTIEETRLQRELDRLALEKPNLLIVAGDLVDDRTTPALMQAACDVVGSFPSTYGTFFVYGNHDLASHGPTPPYTKVELDHALLKHGVRILDDQSVTVAGITLVGRHDASFARKAQRASLDRLLAGVDRNKPVLLIDHQPREAKEAAAAGITLQLSGHTHAGQVWPMSWFARLFSFAYGHRVIHGMHAIISSGMGNRGSVLRSGCTAEMVLIRLCGSKVD